LRLPRCVAMPPSFVVEGNSPPKFGKIKNFTYQHCHAYDQSHIKAYQRS
jgi:hypothetical protein